MKCFKNYDLQAYIDDELDADSRTEIQVHLNDCPSCSEELANLEKGKKFLFKKLSSLNPGEFEIPDLKFSKNKPKSRKILLSTIATTAVASVILLIAIFIPGRKNSDQITIELLFQEYIESQDPDQLWHNKTHLYLTETEDGDLTVISSK